MKFLIGQFKIVKMQDQYFVFYVMPDMGGVKFSEASPPFHTLELAHEFLIDKAKEYSTENTTATCVEVLKEYIFVGENSDNENK